MNLVFGSSNNAESGSGTDPQVLVSAIVFNVICDAHLNFSKVD